MKQHRFRPTRAEAVFFLEWSAGAIIILIHSYKNAGDNIDDPSIKMA